MIKDLIKKYISNNGHSHILIHSDVLFGLDIKLTNPKSFLEDHYNELEDICQPLKMIMPSFNYDFIKGTPYIVKDSQSQVGALSKYFMKNKAIWRTSVPVFNFSGIGNNPLPDRYGKIDPFDKSSLFGFLHEQKGILMHYGSGIHTSTLLHYVERISNSLIYRYDKVFAGQVIDVNNTTHHSELIYHVRPMGYALDYNWEKLQFELIENDIIERYQENKTQILIGRIDRIVDFWLTCLDTDPFYLLNQESRHWVEKKYNALKRPFKLTDFE